MVRKNPNKKNSAADDLLSSLLDEVDQFDSGDDEKPEIEPTVYEGKSNKKPDKKKKEVEVASDFLLPVFDQEKSNVAIGLSKSSAENVSPDDFWEQAEKMANKAVTHENLNKQDDYNKLEKDGKKKSGYSGPEASSDFLDQINAQLSPVHKSGTVQTSSEPKNSKNLAAHSGYDGKSKSNYEGSAPEGNDNRLLTGLDPTADILREIKLEKPEYNDATIPISAMGAGEVPAKIAQAGNNNDSDRTVAVTQFAQKQNKMKNVNEPLPELPQRTQATVNLDPDLNADERILLVTQKPPKVNSSQVSIDASLAQAENLRMAQNRILALEKEIERLRQENDEILTASEVLRTKAEEYTEKISKLEKDAQENTVDFKNEIALAKGNLVHKDHENQKLKTKVEELELRIKTDFKKIRIRERELENRLELIKAEKQAVVKSKDELLLDLQRKNDQAKGEIDNYREKVQELNKHLENSQNQIKMTVRALRIALSHIEDKSDSTIPIKKAN